MHLASHPPSVRSPGAHQMLAGLVFQRHGGLTEPLNTKKHPFSWQHMHLHRKNPVFRRNRCGPELTLSRSASICLPHRICCHPWCSPSSSGNITFASGRSNTTLPHVNSDLAHIMLWVAGGNCPSSCQCNRTRGKRYRGTPPMTLPYLT